MIRHDFGRVVRGVTGVMLCFLGWMPADAAAQTPPVSPRPAELRWSISIGLAGTRNGPAPQFESALRGVQFDDPTPDFRSIPTPHVIRGAGSEMDITYRYNERIAFALLRSSSTLASATGYQDPDAYFYLNARATTAAPLAYLRIRRNVRLGAGPLVAWTDVGDRHEGGVRFKSVKPGAMTSAVLDGSPWRYVSLAITASYRWMPPVTAGPFSSERGGVTVATMPPTRFKMGHGTIGLSMGLRF